MSNLLGTKPDIDYTERISLLQANNIGLWDVLASCERPDSSLDSAIQSDSIQPNDLATFYAGHPTLTHVFFNGAKAEQTYRRQVLPRLNSQFAHLQYTRLPSTSAAHAKMSYAQKLEAWQRILEVID